MSNNTVRLFVDAQFMSPYAMSAFVVLREKKLAFDLEYIDLESRQNLDSGYRLLSTTWRVPTLVHDELALSESSAIAEYLEDIFSAPEHPPVYPQNPLERARAREVQAWLRSDLAPLKEERPTEVIFQKAQSKPLSAKAQSSADKLLAVAGSLLNNKTTLFDQWCIADTDLALMLNRLVAAGDQVPAHLGDYVNAQWQRPSVQAWLELGKPSV